MDHEHGDMFVGVDLQTLFSSDNLKLCWYTSELNTNSCSLLVLLAHLDYTLDRVLEMAFNFSFLLTATSTFSAPS